MNSTLIRWIVTGTVIAGLICSTLAFFFLWQSEKKDVAQAQDRIEEYKEQLKAQEENKEDTIATIAEEFVTVLFTYEKGKEKEREDELKRLSKDPAEAKLLGGDKSSEEEYYESADANVSVTIKNSSYKKKSATEAEATVTFEQTIEAESAKAKTMSEVQLSIQYDDGEWLVTNYTITQMF